MKKLKRILAICGVILLIGLYFVTLLCAIFDRSETMDVFKASIIATFIVPVLIWAYTFIYKLFVKDEHDEPPES